ncbi:hypothetical protein [Phytohabitans houttuyneae]|uniref:Uncharacterized protein n=1 Tax=Phytohabitans houttuyneae TaxID=1076126 RepID=A0A6V8KAQ6_9ACTN|nr:hypothetical protein [Phytohabitans houttuyneae]GFJ79541.1 hypothetical protein Phou_037210 [Phytohabitans houttuyneae]
MSEYAFSTDDAAAVAAYREAVDAERAAARKAVDAAVQLGKNKGALIVYGIWDLPNRVVGLAADDPTDPPEGWRYVKTRDRLEPARGAAGQAARDWLATHQPVDVRAVLRQHGLPRNSRSEAELSGRYRLSVPIVFEHGGVLWAKYTGHLGGVEGECTWTPRKLSEFYAAKEAHEAPDRIAELIEQAGA